MNPESVDDVLGHDHERLGEALDALRSGAGDARPLFQDFDRRLRKHMTWEEEDLFPAVWERATAAQRRSIESLEIDHERIRGTLEDIGAALSGGDVEAAKSGASQLEVYLRGHNYDEEHGVYVEADALLTVERRRLLLEKFAAKG